MARFGHTELPEQIQAALRRAVRLAWVTIAVFTVAVILLLLTMGDSAAMRAAVVENALALVPPIAFLVAVRATKRHPSPRHPYGYHRAVGVGHLVAATALFGLGAFLLVDSTAGLVTGDRPSVGLVQIAGQEVWSGWLMIAVLAYTAVPPVLLGRAKMPLAKTLHDRVLYADAEMNKADWMTAAAAIIGVGLMGLGLWWADVGSAVFIAGSILRDGLRNLRVATGALMDMRIETYDGTDPHPLQEMIDAEAAAPPWVADARCRVRDQGHVFHVEAFLVPADGHTPTLDELAQVREAIIDIDWKLDDVVVIPVEELPVQTVPQADDDRLSDHYDATS